jgi:deoxyribodipyrimidine photo-lyase
MTTLIWLKRDLRLLDHAPLAAAAALGPALALYVLEPAWLQSPECDAQHVARVLSALADVRRRLGERGLSLVVQVSGVVEVLHRLHVRHGLKNLLSHEETGPGWSYERDLAVAAWCKNNGVVWQEFTQTGVVRRLKSRNGWAAVWQRRMGERPVPEAAGWHGVQHELADLPTLAQLGFASHAPRVQAAQSQSAIDTAHEVLRSFLHERGGNYRSAISSPLSAEEGCSRLSAHLAFGTLSMRCVHHATEARIAQAKVSAHPQERRFAHALRGFAGRLRWHCHFMQKLEDEPKIEFENFARVFDGLREADFNVNHFNAWCSGQTGYPMVDACMRSLVATGWLNFRMRAMLVSFASYHLWLHWRQTGLFLARQFLDFEPGIHWSQMQMQSGTTGINTLRIYSPTKQAQDQDPEGVFIRRWVPELAQVPLSLLPTPWLMDAAQQQRAGCVLGRDYPLPVVNDREAVKAAKDRLYGVRRTVEARAEAQAVNDKHGSRKSGLPPSSKAKTKPAAKAATKTTRRVGKASKDDSDAQLSLFD